MYPVPTVPQLRGPLASETIRDQFALISTEFSLMPATIGSGVRGLTGGQWDNALLNAPTILGGSVGSTARPVGLVSGFQIFNRTADYDAGLTSGLVGFVRAMDGRTRLFDGSRVKLLTDDDHNLVMGSGTTELAVTAGGGFFYPPTVNGTATGTPASYTGAVAMVVDRATKKIGLHIGGAWVWTAALS